MNGKSLVLANIGGRIHALGGICPYHFAPLDGGAIMGNCVVCPWHGAMFDVDTGEATCMGKSQPVAVYEVRVEGESILVACAARERSSTAG